MLLADAYVHDLDPFAFRLTDSFGLRWYGLSYAATFVFGWLLMRWMARSRRSPLTVEAAGDLLFYLIAGVLLGGRVGYALFYKPALFVTFRGDVPFWDLLAIHEGGMSSHGGMLGVIVASAAFMRRHRISALHLLDMAAWLCPIGFGLGRLANFVNGELWGKRLPDAMQTYVPGGPSGAPWWSVKYPVEPIDPDHAWTSATPFVEDRIAALEETLDGVLQAGPRFLDDVVAAAQAGQQEVLGALVPQLTAHYPSQLLQAFTEGPFVWLLVSIVWWRPRRPGVVGSAWLIAYGIGRILTEAVRQPDAALTLGLSRGQVLSAVMVVAGAAAITICARRSVEPLGGLAPVRAAPPSAE